MWFRSLGLLNSAALLAGLIFLFILVPIVYNVWFHPLRRYPGPLLWKSTRLTYIHRMLTGTVPFDIAELHEKYGPVVRVAPNELAFAHRRAWKEVMGGGREESLPKWAAVMRSMTNMAPNIQNTVDKDEHAMLRRAMAPGFSDRSLRGQEALVNRHIDLLMVRLRENCGDGKALVDMTKWFGFATFDIIGDLAFGQSFGCLEKSEYHPWIKAIQGAAYAMCFMGACGMMPSFKRIVDALTRDIALKKFAPHRNFAFDLARKRLALGVDRPDLIGPLIEKQDEGTLNFEQVVANSRTLVAAGSETTANNLTGAVFFLSKSPDALRRLQGEIRDTFRSEDEINMQSTANLPYLEAVLNESFRLYPPVAFGMHRVVDRDGYQINDRVVPKNTIVSVQQMAMYTKPEFFVDPMAFHPERWLREGRFATDALETVKPFFYGTRDCIGKNLAWLEMRLILARFVYNFDVKLGPESGNWREIQKSYFLIWTKGPMEVYLMPAVHGAVQ